MIKVKKVLSIAIILSIFVGFEAEAQTGFGLFKPQSSITAPVSVVMDKGFFKRDASQTFFVSQNEADNGGSAIYNQDFSLDYTGGTLSQSSSLKLNLIVDKVDLPWNLKKISSVYNFQIEPSINLSRQLSITLAYEPGNNQFKQVYFFDITKKSWVALPTTDYVKDSKVKALINKPGAMVAVFAKPGTLTVGKASWYKYKNGDFAASPDFPKGSRLRVTNLANNKSVEIVVNDWGPERDKHPDRAIDLDKVAFAKIAKTGEGVIKVSVSPIKIAADRNGRVLGVKAEGLGKEPKIASKSVMILNESDGQTWLEKNSDAVRPIASLSKVVAMSVYLSLKPNLDEQVIYKKTDEDINYRYCKPWENTKVRLVDGAKLKAKDLFNSALVGSANNAVESLVRNSGVSREKFIALMNKTVADWGATQTKFVEPTGLSSQNVSSAKDYALIVSHATKHDEIASASIKPSYSFVTDDKVKHTLKNTNKLIVEQAQLNLKAEQYPIISSKTGFLNEAGYCLMTRVKQGNDNYTIVTLNAPSRDASFTDMADLINYLKFKMTWI